EIALQLGCEVVKEYDVGIAGLHRAIKAVERMKKENVKCIIVVAGMEGALPSVISGLTDIPVIAVPTSIGYGTGEKGLAAIMTMLNSCTSVAVMNIDNGFGAAVMASKLLRINKE
ncbi:MAG: AIR carboxylase family protein, partial [Deferribacterales bacterium]